MTMTSCKKYEDLPIALTVDEVAEVMGICRKTAYRLVKEKNLAVRIGKKRLIIPRDRLISWLNGKADPFTE